jgi:hypothetical protein
MGIPRKLAHEAQVRDAEAGDDMKWPFFMCIHYSRPSLWAIICYQRGFRTFELGQLLRLLAPDAPTK